MTTVVSTVPQSRFEHYGIKFPDAWQVRFVDMPADDETLVAAAREADMLFVGSVHAVSRRVMENCPKLLFIQAEGVGFDKIDVAAAKELGLPVCNNQGVNAASVAEFTVGLMLASLRRMHKTDREIKAGRFEESQRNYRAQGVNEMCSRHVGLVGIGAIGHTVARMLAPYGCRISYYDAFRPSPEKEKEYGVSYLPFEDLIRQCNVISLHVPVLPSTVNLIGKEQLAAMKPETVLINTSRGEVLDQAALAEALEAGTIYAAGIDTLSPEPPNSDHPLLHLSQEAADRLLVTPHVAGTTNEAFTEMLKRSLANMELALAGRPLNNVVNGLTTPRKLA